MSNVKIALRVRPLSNAELSDEKSSKPVVRVEDDQTVAITNLKVPLSHAGDSRERIRRFNFHFCFDSSRLDDDDCATQETVFGKLGKIVLESLARGQDTCVLAYGQSASGKTYTVHGKENQLGLAPRLCGAIMETSAMSDTSLSYFEIYNERVRDLLNGTDLEALEDGKESACYGGVLANSTGSLRVREHPRRGPYVEGLSEIKIETRDQLDWLLKLGGSRRKSAATQRNLQSSRSHALLALRSGNPTTTLTLLDLAGSERPSKVNNVISRQKEGANINKSLVALANVISALGRSGAGRSARYVPYRDSVLTWLLRDTLSSATATTLMVATVSPSASCYSETVNTMRWAARARRIQVVAGAQGGGRTSRGGGANAGASERSVRALRAEVARLKALLLGAAQDKLFKGAVGSGAKKRADRTTQVSLKEGSRPQRVGVQAEDGAESDSTVKGGEGEREGEGGGSLTSLASSRLSLVSNDTPSVPSTQSSVQHSGQAEDLLFGPRLNRAGSVHDFKPFPPLRNKNRQYSSHETLPSIDSHPGLKTSRTPVVRLNKVAKNRIEEKEKNNRDKSNGISEESLPSHHVDTPRTHVPYEPYNKRAVIVASVTDRLYSLSKRRESIMEKNDKGMTIKKTASDGTPCETTRKKLFDISYRALRASRRLRIGIPAETQTENGSLLRVKEVGIDIQDDIEPFPFNGNENGKQFCNASVATETFTLLCKEKAVGPPGGSVHSHDKGVETEKMNGNFNFILTRTCGNMTEEANTFNTTSTQTQEFPPPRKKHSSFTKYLKVTHDPSTPENNNDRLTPQVFNISISHDCNQQENETDCISDDSLENESKISCTKSQKVHITPDLLNNHNPTENQPCREKSQFPETPIENQTAECFRMPSGNLRNNNFGDKSAVQYSIAENCSVERNNKSTDCRDFAEVTKSNNIIKSDMGDSNGRRGDRVPGADNPTVTWRISPSGNALVFNADTGKSNKNVGTDKTKKENYLRESKSTQVDSKIELCYADFLDDIYVPLPRICVAPEPNVERWPTMKNLILGRNENIYPYNIKLSPKRDDTRKQTKSVSWKSNIVDNPSQSTNRRSLKRLPKSMQYESYSNRPDNHPIYQQPYDSESEGIERNDFCLNSQEDRNVSEMPRSRTPNFQGIYCWNDREQTQKHNLSKTKTKQPESCHCNSTHSHDSQCLQYMEATSNLIREATNLVSSLNQSAMPISDRKKGTLLTERNTLNTRPVSPICNETLQNVDENNKYFAKRPENFFSEPSTSSKLKLQSLSNDFKRNPRIINRELVNNEEYFKMPHENLVTRDMNQIVFSNNEDLTPDSGEIEEVEKRLFASIDHLQNYAENSEEYFSTIPRRFHEKFDHQLASLPPNLSRAPSPYPRMKRNPSKYLEELLKLRKEVVESTKRDDFICRQFQVDTN